MRTRFLLTDYSDPAIAGDCCDSAGILDFVMLPSAEVSADDSFSASVDALRCLDALPLLETCDDVEKLETDDALSMFLSDVLPHFVCGEGLIDGEDFKHDEAIRFNRLLRCSYAFLTSAALS
ncbi:hypothetical protein M569_09794 [Genlisea aurea]|uniref:Uncharacterized protein n=1 Tax=Genlisea aurea TaxID=192259 RepID=S8DYF7_9LAMI|nr:hypothetical protein M569_09794 [Genlisea aurea]